MFNWFRRKSLPPFSSANPGRGTSIHAGFSNAEGIWEERGDALDALAEELASQGIAFDRGKEHLSLPDGLIVRPQFVHLQPRDDGSVQTTTTIEINHPELAPAGLFEFQHAVGNTLHESMKRGFASWAESDLPVLSDALREPAENCLALVRESPAPDGGSGTRKRQLLFGPVVHMAARDELLPEGSSQSPGGSDDTPDSHTFCPCCLLTNCLDQFREHVDRDGLVGLRLFAMRKADGTADADCRVNGGDWEPGAEALKRYVATWPDRGVEFRKQFVLIRTLPTDTRAVLAPSERND